MSGSRKKPPAQVGKVVSLRPAPETTADIVRDVQDHTRQRQTEILVLLESAVAGLEQRHRKRAQECVPIGCAMDRPTLDDWIEIGQRLLAAKGGRR